MVDHLSEDERIPNAALCGLYASMAGVQDRPIVLESMRRAAKEIERLMFIIEAAAPNGWVAAAEAEWERVNG